MKYEANNIRNGKMQISSVSVTGRFVGLPTFSSTRVHESTKAHPIRNVISHLCRLQSDTDKSEFSPIIRFIVE